MKRRRRTSDDPLRLPLDRGRPRRGQLGSLLDLFKRGLDGGAQAALEYLQTAADAGSASADAFMQQWNQLSVQDRKQISWEVVCARAGLKPEDVTGIVIWQATRHASNIARLRAATTLPEVVETSLTEARKSEGFRDRQLILESQKFVERTPSVVIDQSSTTEQHLHLPSLEEVLGGAALPRPIPPLLLDGGAGLPPDEINNERAVEGPLEGEIVYERR